MHREELIKKMQARVDQCRRLAQATTDRDAATILNAMADEGEADIKRLLDDRDAEAKGLEPSA